MKKMRFINIFSRQKNIRKMNRLKNSKEILEQYEKALVDQYIQPWIKTNKIGNSEHCQVLYNGGSHLEPIAYKVFTEYRIPEKNLDDTFSNSFDILVSMVDLKDIIDHQFLSQELLEKYKDIFY